MSLNQYAKNIPRANEITRLETLTFDEFQSTWVNQPFMLTKTVTEWPIFRNWSTESLLEKYANVPFRAEAVDWPLKTYVDYLNNSRDESPLYLFDRAFAEKMD